MTADTTPSLSEKLKRLRQIRYDVPTRIGEVEKLIPKHLLEEAIDAAARAEAAEANARRLEDALGKIAEGVVPPDQHGHYLAHRVAVKIARMALKPTTKEADRD